MAGDNGNAPRQTGQGVALDVEHTPPDAGIGRAGFPAPRRSYLLSRLLLIVLSVAGPLVALQVGWLLLDKREAQAAVFRDLSMQSRDAAANVDDVLSRAEQLLQFIASRRELKSMDPDRCNELLRGIAEMGSAFSNLLFVNTAGEIICTSSSGGRTVTFADRAWFKQGLIANGFALSEPVVGRLTNKKVALLTLPVQQTPGGLVGLLAIAIDLNSLSGALLSGDLPAGGSASVVMHHTVLLARRPDPDVWIGRVVSDDARSKLAGLTDGVAVATSVDGVERAFAVTELGRYDLRVAIGTPVDPLYGKARLEVAQKTLVALVVTLLGLVLAYRFYRRLALPLTSITNTVRKLASGESGIHADESLPGEFGEMAAEFNRLTLRQQEGTAQLIRSERRALRISTFYEALSSTNQAIVRMRTKLALFDEVCSICVRTGLAEMAWIGEVDGQSMTPVAWGGRALEYTRGLVIEIPDTPAEAVGTTASAVMSARPVVANKFLRDPRTERWRSRAARFNVRAVAAFPFMRDGVVVGTLNLYVSEEDYFDDEMVALLDNMMGDISIALDAQGREAARVSAERALRQRELQMSGIVESVADAIVTVDSRQLIVVCNRAAGELFCVDPRDAIGRPITMYIPGGLSAAGDDPAGNGIASPVYLAGLREDGSALSLKAMISSQSSEPGLLVTAVLVDQTRQQQAERARAASREADVASRARAAFLSRVSHELRTPLNAILGFTQLLRNKSSSVLDDSGRQHLDLVFSAARQLRSLIDDVQDISRVEAGQMSLELQDVELNQLLVGVLQMCEPLGTGMGVSIRADFAGAPRLRIRSDPVRLRQVVLNLVSNAIKYNKPDGTVTVSFELTDDYVNLRVIDTGLGMSDAQLADLFQPFNRLGRQHTSIEGTGIGMNLTRQLVEMFGGTLTVESAEGVGTAVTVRLPYVGAVAEPLAAAEGGARSGYISLEMDDEPSGVVLYIEDNPVNAILIEQLLSIWGDVRVVVVPTGREGLALAAELRPDLVLLDMQLPDISGMEILAQLKAGPLTSELRVVALSANALPDEILAALQMGAEDYWTKPIDFNQVLMGIAQKLKSSRPMPDVQSP